MKLLALDQAVSITGYAIFDNGKLDSYGLIDHSKTEDSADRFRLMSDSIVRLIMDTKPKMVVFEDVALQISPAVLVTLARLQGVLIYQCNKRKIKFRIYRPSVWRKLLGFQQGKNVTRPKLKKQALTYVNNTYDLDVKIDTAEAICIGSAYYEGDYDGKNNNQ